jgi:ELWxxDGT repeat protein
MRKMSLLLIAFLAVSLLIPRVMSAIESTSQLKNINQATNELISNPVPNIGLHMVGDGNRTYFTYLSPANGQELWVSDGTVTGTKLVRDLNPGPAPASIPATITSNAMLMVGSKLFVRTEDGIWVSDGTTNGTNPLVIQELTDPFPKILNLNIVGAVAGKAYFANTFTSSGFTLWVSDGTTNGTSKIRDFASQANSARFCTADSVMYIMTRTQTATELWKSDGTATGTVKVTDLPEEPHGSCAAIGETIYFFNGSGGQRGLWKSDGTAAGTQPVRALDNPGEIIAIGSTLYFQSTDQAQSPKTALWQSDGTTNGTTLIQSFNANLGNNNEVRHLTNIDGKLYFAGENGNPSVLNGTTVTKLSASVDTASNNWVASFTKFGSNTFFFAKSNNNSELWKSDGTAAGTVRVSLLVENNTSSAGKMAATNNHLLFTFGPTSFPEIGALWLSDGTTNGTQIMLPRAYEAGVVFRYDEAQPQFTELQGTLFFSAFHSETGQELWATDGTSANTRLVKDIYPGINPVFANGGNPSKLIVYKNQLYFFAFDGTGLTLWRSDGTANGTQKITTIVVDSVVTGVAEQNQMLFFTTEGYGDLSGPTNGQLWRSDGTAAGTQLITTTASARDLTVAGDMLYFTARFGNQIQLIASNGSPGNATALTNEPQTFFTTPTPFELTEWNDALYFFYSGQQGTTLQKTTGTISSTVIIDTIAQFSNVRPTDVTIFKEKLYFRFHAHPQAPLWVSDGTAAGTFELFRFVPSGYRVDDPLPASTRMVALDTYLLFSADDGFHGNELWVSDGTAAGTRQINDILPGLLGSNITNMHVFAGKAFFTASNATYGMELWASNGTTESTVQVTDIAPNAESSNPEGMILFGNRIYAVADDGTTGKEVWSAANPKNNVVRLPLITGR